MSVRVESIIKITKNSSTFYSTKKIECLVPWLGHVRKKEVTLLSKELLHRVYSAFDTLFPSRIINSLLRFKNHLLYNHVHML